MAKYVLSFLLMFVMSLEVQAQEFVPGEVIVKLKTSESNQAYQFLGKASLQKNMKLSRSWKRLNMYKFKLQNGDDVKARIKDIVNEPEVEYAEPNYILKKSDSENHGVMSMGEVQAMSSDSRVYSTDANIGLEKTVNSTPVEGSGHPIVAVIDTGVDLSHPVFKQSGAIWTNTGEIANNGVDDDGNGYIDDVNGWNFVDNSNHIYDDDNHGTHVAGTILSVSLDIFNTTVAESNIRIMPIKFLNGNGVGTTSGAIDAINYAVNNGATILNNSWGGEGYSTALHEAILNSYNHGTLFVAAAGNMGSNNDSRPIYPASYDVPNVVSVAATTSSDYLASFSNYGYNSVVVGSPGVYILSTVPGDRFAYMSGTSMAAPIVAGVASMVKTVSPDMLGFQVKQIVEDSSVLTTSLSGKVATGARVDAFKAADLAETSAVSKTQPSYSISGGRSLSSVPAQVAGCGVVSKLGYNQYGGNGPKGPSSGNAVGLKFLMALLLLGPIVLNVLLRRKSGNEKRQHERFEIDSDVRIKVGDSELVGSVSTISLGGLQLNTDALLEQGGVVKMSISSPDGQEVLEVSGQVVWSKERQSYGVKFADTPTSILNRISMWTSGLVKSAT